MRFFFDNCVSSNLAKAMRLLNEPHHVIEHLTDRFPADTLDEEWLPVLAPETDLIVVSADPAISTSKKQREVWRGTGLTTFFFGSGFADRGIWPQVIEVVRWWPEIVRTASESQRGAGYLLPFQGKKKPQLIYSPPPESPN